MFTLTSGLKNAIFSSDDGLRAKSEEWCGLIIFLLPYLIRIYASPNHTMITLFKEVEAGIPSLSHSSGSESMS